MSLQFKLAQEKTVKTIKSTAASISSSIKTISQDLFSRKIDPVVLNNGYKEFYARYEEDMKRLEESLKAMEIASSHITDEWRASEEEQKKRIAELQEENSTIVKNLEATTKACDAWFFAADFIPMRGGRSLDTEMAGILLQTQGLAELLERRWVYLVGAVGGGDD